MNFKSVILGGLIVNLGISCAKNEEAFQFDSSRDIAYMLSIGLEGLPLVLNAKDSLVNGDSLWSECKFEYVSGDTIGFPNQIETVTFRYNYDTLCTDIDGRIKSGKIRLLFYPQGSEFDYSIIYDSCYISGYYYSGSVSYVPESNQPGAANEYNYRIYSNSLRLFNGPRDADMQIKAFANYDPIMGKTIYFMERQTGNGSDERKFKYEGDSIIYDHYCRQITAGEILVKPYLYPWRTIDFGDENCDNYAKVEGGNFSLRFVMP